MMAQKVLVIDNFDSFTYNLVQYLAELGATVVVRRNTATLDELRAVGADRILVSPGPGAPHEAGISGEAIRAFALDAADPMPVLGVCLGHQCLGYMSGATVERAPELMHGKVSKVRYTVGEHLFAGMPNPFQATRYHSLIVREDTLPDDLLATAWSESGLVMGLRHATKPVFGVQFHPESILTENGKQILQNFLEYEKRG